MEHALTIYQLMEKHAALTPAKIALVHGKVSYTYGKFNQQANQLARLLLTHSLSPNTIISVSLERSPELLIAIAAILKSGCAYLALDHTQPKERLQYILDDSQAPILITHTSLRQCFPDYQGRFIFIDELEKLSRHLPTDNINLDVDPSNLAYVIYTSGTTGKPKGVLVEHHSLLNYCLWFENYAQVMIKHV